jgi:hypothetical protein
MKQSLKQQKKGLRGNSVQPSASTHHQQQPSISMKRPRIQQQQQPQHQYYQQQQYQPQPTTYMVPTISQLYPQQNYQQPVGYQQSPAMMMNQHSLPWSGFGISKETQQFLSTTPQYRDLAAQFLPTMTMMHPQQQQQQQPMMAQVYYQPPPPPAQQHQPQSAIYRYKPLPKKDN